MLSELNGTIHHVGEIKERGENGKWKTATVVVKTAEQYPNYYPIEIDVVKNADKFAKIKAGQSFAGRIAVNGKSYTNKQGQEAFFVTIKALSFETEPGFGSIEGASLAEVHENLPF